MSKIEPIDLKIIEFLQADGNTPNTMIAKSLGISEATVRRRLERLQREDVIRITAVANPFKLGFTVMVIVGIEVERSKLAEVERQLLALPTIRFLGVTVGNYDLMMEAWFKSNDELLEFLTVTLAHVDGIIRTESFQIMRLSKYTYDWGKPPASRVAINSDGNK